MVDSMKEAWQQREPELDRLFSEYRDACEAPEARADFMPRLWERIDARRGWSGQVWRWANGMALVAAVASLFFVMLQMVPRANSEFYGTTYLETLADQHDDDDLGDVAVLKTRPVSNGPAQVQEFRKR